jgi:hypothetical protein
MPFASTPSLSRWSVAAFPMLVLALGACSSSSSSPATTADAGKPDTATGGDAQAPGITEHGKFVDYFTLKPVAGLTISDNGVSTTSDAMGQWSLTVPAASTLLQPTVTSPTYSKLLFPDSKAIGTDVDHGDVVVPDTQAFTIEQATLAKFDNTKALVQLVVNAIGTCASVEGGTVKVLTPTDAVVVYFAAGAVPDDTLSSFQKVTAPRPVAVIYNVTPGADVTLQIDHPTCKVAPSPAVAGGPTFTGKVRTVAAQPDNVNAALVVTLQ